ncbi:MAG: WG repeat-containing protein [Muribaculaceae bacterium]|nr:WG repeat-containing protein [Muribaculaceae bacterium]
MKFSTFLKTSFTLLLFNICNNAFAELEYSPYYTVTITPETKWVDVRGKVYALDITNIYDGVWGCRINNGWGFYSIDGTKIYDYIWTAAESQNPEFHNGVVPAFKKDDDYNTRCIYLLHKDGKVKKLDRKYSACTNFCDGVALAKINYNTYVFIDPEGNEVYPGVTSWPETNSFYSNQVQSISDGMRAYYDPKPGKWGFLDDKGKIAVEPKFMFVRNFNDGRALVSEGNGNVYFIDKTGKKAFEPQWDYMDNAMSNISDYNSGYCTVWQDGYTIYYDTEGNEVKAIKFGKNFVDGYAWFVPMKGKDDRENFYIPMDSKFQTMEKAYHTPTDAFTGFVNGYMRTQGRMVKPDGKIQIYGAMGIIPNYNMSPLIFYDLNNFNEDGYMDVSLKIGDNRYNGFINTKGEMVVVYEWDKREVKEVTSRYLRPGVSGPAKLKEDYVVSTIPIKVCSQTPLGPIE